MKLKGTAKTKLENAIEKQFPGFILDANAPQGQNRFSCNYSLKKDDQHFLLKILLKEKIKAQINKDQAISEVSIYKTIHSHYVLSLCDTKEDNDYIFLLFPFLKGKSLDEYLDTKTFREEEIIEIGISILRGIADIWRKRIVHQDIKPNNIFIETDGSVKILDFGSARFQVSPFRGSGRQNYEYSSPEQILTSRPFSAELLRITLDDRSDVYATGLILYYLIEGKHPFADFEFPADAICNRNPVPLFTRLDISSGLKKIVMRMLDPNQLNRPNAQTAIGYLDAGEVIAPELQNGGFYYCVTTDTSRLLKIKNDAPNLFDGIIIEASLSNINNKRKREILGGTKTILIDPQVYLFQRPKHQSVKFKKLPYFDYQDLFQDPAELLLKIENKDPRVINLINDIAKHQLNAGATAIVPPFLYVDEFGSEAWSVDQEITNLSLEYLEEYKSVKPLIKGIAISQQILTSDQSRNRILTYLTALSDRIEGYMILLESSHSEVISDEPWLRGSQDLFTRLLGTGKYVIWSKADVSSLVLAPTGVSIAMGERPKQRRFNIVEEKPTGWRTVPHFYISSLFARVTWPDAFRALSEYEKIDELSCSGTCCSSINFSSPSTREEEDLAEHMMFAIGDQLKRYRGGDGKNILVGDIERAKEHYELLRTNKKLIVKQALKNNIKPSSGSFLDSWLNALNR